MKRVIGPLVSELILRTAPPPPPCTHVGQSKTHRVCRHCTHEWYRWHEAVRVHNITAQKEKKPA
jgi:hypothetical protein